MGRIIPTDELIFFRGVGIPPTSIYYIIYIYNDISQFIHKDPSGATEKLFWRAASRRLTTRAVWNKHNTSIYLSTYLSIYIYTYIYIFIYIHTYIEPGFDESIFLVPLRELRFFSGNLQVEYGFFWGAP